METTIKIMEHEVHLLLLKKLAASKLQPPADPPWLASCIACSQGKRVHNE